MRALAPRDGMTALKREMDRLLERFWDWDLPAEFPVAAEWRPTLDLKETRDPLVQAVEVPGVDPKDLNVTLEGDLLTLKGERRQEKTDEDERLYRMERSYGAFTRVVRLPAPVDGRKVATTFKNGVLTIQLPKTAAAVGTSIPIQVG